MPAVDLLWFSWLRVIARLATLAPIVFNQESFGFSSVKNSGCYREGSVGVRNDPLPMR